MKDDSCEYLDWRQSGCIHGRPKGTNRCIRHALLRTVLNGVQPIWEVKIKSGGGVWYAVLYLDPLWLDVGGLTPREVASHSRFPVPAGVTLKIETRVEPMPALFRLER
jgi:hypothetical protein